MGFGYAVLLGASAVGSAAGAQTTAATPPGWTVNEGASVCNASFTASGASEPALRLFDRALSDETLLTFTLPAPVDVPYGAPVRLVLQPSGTVLQGQADGFAPGRGPTQTIGLSVKRAQLKAKTVSALRLSSENDMLVDLPVERLAAALTSLQACQESLLAHAGIARRDYARIATFARPLTSPRDWFVPESYPAEARRAREQGRVAGRFRILKDGTVADCLVLVSSGFPSLDEGTCAVLLAKARYRPARDASGQAVVSPQLFAVYWALP
ncbi:energy transducer TonB [Sphingomonas aracearum]|uniref:Energy transducer TonB n=1 Tax=Sphingomonas aracearum TaxID=2283317 RepID=A0A369VTL2_9SPHN|nr:energy transducer TonB [Sphingomonas aracearum]RDE05744.1 energy transducer TonB [Sphingomonas aracearum]